MKVAKWGNSLAVRLPAGVVEALELKDGDDIEIVMPGARSLCIETDATRRAFVDRMRKYEGRMPRDFKFDRRAANERE